MLKRARTSVNISVGYSLTNFTATWCNRCHHLQQVGEITSVDKMANLKPTLCITLSLFGFILLHIVML